jgi:NAD(P)-dependent dehydrogenase (short-subunit alcohol dehydrogenase family)
VNEIRKNGWKATALTVDVSVEESVKNLVEQTVETYGEVDVLVNNAGVYPLIPLRDMSLADFDS